MSETATIPKLRRSVIDRNGPIPGYEKWLVENHLAEIIEDVPKERQN